MMDRRQVPWIILFFVVLFETLVLWQMSKREPVASIQAGDIGCPPIQKDMKQLRDQVTQLTATVDKTEKETKQIIAQNDQLRSEIAKISASVNPLRAGEVPKVPVPQLPPSSVEPDKYGYCNDVCRDKLKAVPVILFGCNRADYIRRALTTLFSTNPGPRHPIYVSLDCNREDVYNTVDREFGMKLAGILRHTAPPMQRGQDGVPSGENPSYYAISRHYKWGLSQIFDVMKYNATIILEDDIEPAVDFFDMFDALMPMSYDTSVLCISAWNDNGAPELVSDNKALYRSDFFPGYGWSMTKELWNELKPKWPAAYWDDWLRMPEQRKGRSILRPEVTRSTNFGEHGVSGGQFFQEHIGRIKANAEFVNFTSMDLSYLQREAFERWYDDLYRNAMEMSVDEVYRAESVAFKSARAVRIIATYNFASVAHQFRLMDDDKSGIKRMGYRGSVLFRWHGVYVFVKYAM